VHAAVIARLVQPITLSTRHHAAGATSSAQMWLE